MRDFEQMFEPNHGVMVNEYLGFLSDLNEFYNFKCVSVHTRIPTMIST